MKKIIIFTIAFFFAGLTILICRDRKGVPYEPQIALTDINNDFWGFDTITSIQIDYYSQESNCCSKLTKFKNLETVFFRTLNSYHADSIIALIKKKNKIKNLLFYSFADSVLPQKITTLKNLKFLMFASSSISNVPEYILSLKKLEVIKFGGRDYQNHRNGGGSELREFPTILLKMKSLKVIDITGSQIQNIENRIFNNSKGIKIVWE